MRIAATAGSTAFQWWHSKGKEHQTGAEVRFLAVESRSAASCLSGLHQAASCSMLKLLRLAMLHRFLVCNTLQLMRRNHIA